MLGKNVCQSVLLFLNYYMKTSWISNLILFLHIRKSSLLRQLKNPLEETNGYMIVCKFDQTDSPDTILSSGFDSFFEGILNESEHVKTDLKTRINQVLRVDVA